MSLAGLMLEVGPRSSVSGLVCVPIVAAPTPVLLWALLGHLLLE